MRHLPVQHVFVATHANSSPIINCNHLLSCLFHAMISFKHDGFLHCVIRDTRGLPGTSEMGALRGWSVPSGGGGNWNLIHWFICWGYFDWQKHLFYSFTFKNLIVYEVQCTLDISQYLFTSELRIDNQRFHLRLPHFQMIRSNLTIWYDTRIAAPAMTSIPFLLTWFNLNPSMDK